MIKAKVTVFDDETGEIYDEDKIIGPCRIDNVNQGLVDSDVGSGFIIKEYTFGFSLRRMTIIGEQYDSVPLQQEKVHTMPSDTQ